MADNQNLYNGIKFYEMVTVSKIKIIFEGNAIFKYNKNYDSSIYYFRKALQYRPEDYFDGNYNMAATFMNQGI